MTDCTRGCLTHGQHTPDCTHTHECPATCTNHCEGCAPKQTEHGLLCRHCTNQLRDNLNALPELVAGCHSMPSSRLVTKARANADRRPTRVDQISPAPALDLADEVEQWAYEWAVTVADTLRHRGPMVYRVDGVPDTRHITRHVAYLIGNLDTITQHEWCEDLYDETRTHERTLRARTGQDQLIHRLRDRCPTCNQRTLTREDGAAKVICNNRDCNRVWTEDEYTRLAIVAAS